MANLSETATYEAGVYQLETTDPVLGGPGGIANQQAQQLANRTKYLKEHVDALEAGTGLGDGTIAPVKMAPGGVLRSNVRNCVLTGPVAVDGTPASYSVNAARILRIPSGVYFTFAVGFNSYGQVDYFHNTTGNEDVDIDDFVDPASSKIYLYASRNAAGTVSYKVTDVPPVFSPIEPTAGALDIWFNTADMKVYQYNDILLSFQQLGVGIVLLGEATRDGSGDLDEIIPYPYRDDVDSDKAVPTGSVLAFAEDMTASGKSIPRGYLYCNGAAVSRQAYKNLFTLMGTRYGTGDGSTTFNLPDLRGEFIRGWDNGRGVDSGRVIGSAQADEFKAHTHLEYSWNAAGSTTIGGAGGNFGQQQTGSAGGAETRPRNIAMMYLIKY